MDAHSLLIFLPACFALNLAPGPNNLLSVSNGARYGFRSAWLGGLGRLPAFAGMIGLTALGLAVVLYTSEWVFALVKALGAAYLVYLAWGLWRAPVRLGGAVGESPPGGGSVPGLGALMGQEFWVAAGNPKAILIFTAFLPQFVGPGEPFGPRFLVLGGIFLVLEIAAIALYALLGARLGLVLSRPGAQRGFNRASAALLGMAGLALLFSRRAGA